MTQSDSLLDRLEIDCPIISAPMAGVSTPEMAAAVSNAGALGSIAVGATNAAGAEKMLADFRGLSSRSLNVNVFCHRPAHANVERESRWIERLRPEFERFGATPPASLKEIYRSFVEDDEMLELLVAAKPKVVSFHFGLPPLDRVCRLVDAGILLFGTATNLVEAKTLVAAGVNAIVAQGAEAGGHRGMFDPDSPDDTLSTKDLTQLLVRELDVPIIAAGGMMTGGDIEEVLRLGSSAAQLGTAFVSCDESLADAGFKKALLSSSAGSTLFTRAISGRPARCISNRFTSVVEGVSPVDVPDYPIAYDLGKALHAAAKAKDEFGFGAQWSGTGGSRARAMPAAKLVATLREELAQARFIGENPARS